MTTRQQQLDDHLKQICVHAADLESEFCTSVRDIRSALDAIERHVTAARQLLAPRASNAKLSR